jgi:alpha-1,3-rhamnosyl/mannosyltransferase
VSLAEVQARYGLPRRWFVYPAFTWWHKDHALAVKAFATLAAREHDVVLVLTGGEGPAEQSVMELIDSLGLRGRVRRTGLIPRRDVLAIVRGATALVYPSRYEGFGLPVAEAMSLGTPVLAADATSLPEVVGDAGWLLPPGRIDDWSEAMARMLVDGDERQRLGEAGRARAAKFTWAATAEATVTSYRDVAAIAEFERDAESPGETPPDETPPDEMTDEDQTHDRTPDDNGVAT